MTTLKTCNVAGFPRVNPLTLGLLPPNSTMLRSFGRLGFPYLQVGLIRAL